MQVRVTDNFIANLQSIEDYWLATDFSSGYDQLIESLSLQVIPNLESYPQMGRLFSRHAGESVDALLKMDKFATHLPNIREYLLEDYLLLYLLSDSVFLLAIKHHLQLSYDLSGLWLSR